MHGFQKRDIVIEVQPNGCHHCTSHLRQKGYTKIWCPVKKGMIFLTKIVYEKTHGKIPEGLCVRHTCDNPSCCNIQHLILGTHQQNMEDRNKRGRTAKGSKVGRSKLTEQQVIEILSLKGLGFSASSVGKRYNMGHRIICSIWNNEAWKHLPRQPYYYTDYHPVDLT